MKCEDVKNTPGNATWAFMQSDKLHGVVHYWKPFGILSDAVHYFSIATWVSYFSSLLPCFTVPEWELSTMNTSPHGRWVQQLKNGFCIWCDLHLGRSTSLVSDYSTLAFASHTPRFSWRFSVSSLNVRARLEPFRRQTRFYKRIFSNLDDRWKGVCGLTDYRVSNLWELLHVVGWLRWAFP